MKNEEFKLLLEKYDSEEITNEELERLKYLTQSDPSLKREFEMHRKVIFGIISNALREELKKVMDEEEEKNRSSLCIYIYIIIIGDEIDLNLTVL